MHFFVGQKLNCSLESSRDKKKQQLLRTARQLKRWVHQLKHQFNVLFFHFFLEMLNWTQAQHSQEVSPVIWFDESTKFKSHKTIAVSGFASIVQVKSINHEWTNKWQIGWNELMTTMSNVKYPMDIQTYLFRFSSVRIWQM